MAQQQFANRQPTARRVGVQTSNNPGFPADGWKLQAGGDAGAAI
jgi:hypothetical protein